MLPIPGIRDLIKSFEHRKPESSGITGLLVEPGAPSDDSPFLARLAAYLRLDILAAVEVAPGGKSAEVIAAGRNGLMCSLSLPALEERGPLATLIQAGKPQGGRERVFVTSEIFPRDGSWCDLIPMDSSHAFFFVPVALPAAVGRPGADCRPPSDAVTCGSSNPAFVLGCDTSLPDADYMLEVRTYLAASLLRLADRSRAESRLPRMADSFRHFLKVQGFSYCLADGAGEAIETDGSLFASPDRQILASVKRTVLSLESNAATEAGPLKIALDYGPELTGIAYRVEQPEADHEYLLVLSPQLETGPFHGDQWLKLLGRFTSSVAHEIKNPLTGIAAGVQYLAKRLQPGLAEADTVDFILAEIARLNRIVDDLYKIARPPQLVLGPTSINEVIARSLFGLGEEIVRKRLRLEQRLDRNVPIFDGDAERLQQVIVNVLKNAVEASAEGGRIDIVTAFDRGLVRVKIKDAGPGVPDADRERIFEPFFSTKKGGTGLGLCISQAIVREHGGCLWLESPLGGGAAFGIDLPARSEHGDNTPGR